MTDATQPTADEYSASAGAMDSADGAAGADRWAATRAAEAVKDNLARQLREAAAREEPLDPAVIHAAYDALASVAALARRSEPSAQPQTLGAVAADYWARIEARREALSTGLAALDDALGGGFQPGRLVALLGGPGAGKTALANQIAEHIADSGRPVVYLTLEDGAPVLLAKTLARLADLDFKALLSGREHRARVDSALAALARRRSAERLLYVDDTGRLSLAQLAGIARAHFAQHDAERAGASGGGPGLLVVDYLQRWARAQRGADPRAELRQQVSTAADALSNLARELGCTVLALSSMNRASGYGLGKNGNVNAIAAGKESGDLEYSADVLMAIVEDGDRTAPLGFDARKLRLDKNRQGVTTAIDLDWRGARQQFTGVAK